MEEYIENIEVIIKLIAVICTAIVVNVGIITYIKQQKINRIQNLITVFQRFANNDDFILLFSLCDSSYVKVGDSAMQTELNILLDEIRNITTDKKLKYLALLEEIAIYAKNSSVIREHAIHLFKFHFFYVYGNNPISLAFWNNVGGNKEKEKEGWSYQNIFAKICEKNIIK